ncbi:hypothetical protein DIPPA_35764 [Diplonema papillatum]|nr:hypothetical protein DIPPA_35764 [Diplonema papillatum]
MLRIRAGHNEAMRDLAPLARPPPEELGPYYPQESRLGPHIAASSLAASPHTQGASYTRLDELVSPRRNPVSAIRLRRNRSITVPENVAPFLTASRHTHVALSP